MDAIITYYEELPKKGGYRWNLLLGEDNYNVNLYKVPEGNGLALSMNYRINDGIGDALDPVVITNFGLGRFRELADTISGLCVCIMCLDEEISEIKIGADNSHYSIEDWGILQKTTFGLDSHGEILQIGKHPSGGKKKDAQYQRFLLYKRYIDRFIKKHPELVSHIDTKNRSITISKFDFSNTILIKILHITVEDFIIPLYRFRSYFIPGGNNGDTGTTRSSCSESDTIVTMTPALGCGIIVEKNTDQMHARRES